jgi:hypothetical protein
VIAPHRVAAALLVALGSRAGAAPPVIGLAATAAIELTVATTGAVDTASVGSAPGDMADCVKRAMLRVRLPAPRAVDKVRIELQLGPTK